MKKTIKQILSFIGGVVLGITLSNIKPTAGNSANILTPLATWLADNFFGYQMVVQNMVPFYSYLFIYLVLGIMGVLTYNMIDKR